MATVAGVLGPIDTAHLGFTLMHEHVLVANWAMRQNFPDYVDTAQRIAEATEEARAAGTRGVRTIVDLTAINLGRDVQVIRDVARASGVQFIAATGFYWTEEPWMESWDADTLAGYLIRDLTEGMQGTTIKAGIIKCATDRLGVTELNRKLLQVAARAHRRTGAPISTHTSVAHETGLAQQEVFEAEGVDLTRVVIGHCGDSEDLDYLERILRRGSTIGMDRFGIEALLSTAARVATIAALVKRGWAGQMVLSHDACCYIDWFPMEVLRAAVPNWNFRHIPDDVIPALRAQGVSEADIGAMTVGNPRRIFERQGAY
jgi:phosphotriesterase-related protein